MNIYITFDYEIFFGSNHGTVEKTLIQPTEKLLAIARKNNSKYTFFIDCGMLLKLKEYQNRFPQLKEEYQLISQQIKQIQNEGHDCQLHIHPHWEKTIFDGQKWIFDYNFYKLSDFSQDEVLAIFRKYSDELKEITGVAPIAYRAGGWCAQPFDLLKPAFIENKIQYDSSVFVSGKNIDAPYYYDYTNAPNKDFWKFENDLCIEEDKGQFSEIPISSYHYSPLFFWRLFILGNLFPKSHKPIGDGKPMPSSMTRTKMLTQSHFLSAGVDGYFVSKVGKIIDRNARLNYQHTVLLGHPKAATDYSVTKLNEIVMKHSKKHQFISFSQIKTKK